CHERRSILQGNERSRGQHANQRGELVCRSHLRATEPKDLVTERDTCRRDYRVLEQLLHKDTALRFAFGARVHEPRAHVERAMFGVTTGHEIAEEVRDLVAAD